MQPALGADDAALLRRYADARAEDAFAGLVRRHIGLVHGAARRQVADEAAAADVTQAVFTELARQARRLARHPALAGWLYTTTRRLAARHVRGETRRRRREQEAHAMQELARDEAPEPAWEQVGPVLDAAMHDLGETDRLAVLLRCLEQRPHAEVGARLGLSAEAARMRVDRALDRLRGHLARRGVTSTAAALALALGGHAVATVPAALTASVTAGALAGAAGSTFGIFTLMASTKLKAAAVAALILGAGTALVLEHQAARRLRDENAGLQGRMAALSAEAEAARLAAAAAPQAPQAQQARPNEELLALRGEVARLRRELASRLPMPPPPQAGNISMPEAEPDRAVALTSVQALMPTGHTLVAGGWDWTEDRRGLLLITPTSVVGQDGRSIVELEYLTVLLPGAVAEELGLAGQAEGEPGGPGPRVFDPEAALVLRQELEGREGVEVLAVPRITTASGQAASVGLASDATPFALSFEALPTVTADGLIDLRNEGRIEGVPPGGSPPPQP